MTRHAISTAVGTFLLAIMLTACSEGGTTSPNPPGGGSENTPTTPNDPENPPEPKDPTPPEDPAEPESPLPPNPEDIAPALTRADVTLKSQTAFLYTGPNPIQTGVAEGTIVEARAAVIRGRVLDRNDAPLPGVKITIKDQEAFGQTLSRADGQFDMAVNGGGLLTINYEKAGYLPVQRQVRPQWNDYAFADDIVMIQLDPEVTTVQLGNGQPMQVVQGSPQTDADGTRQATILFPTNTTATMTLPDGSTQALTTLNVRATEYTVGDNGFEATPGELPLSSGYTYAVELSIDEAMAAGSNRVDFSQPVPVYVDNFLNFPTGEIVPAGYYDHSEAVWKAGDNGRVIEVLRIEDGLAILDLEGEGQAATTDELQALGIEEEEQQKIATLYSAGNTLWRTPISHFTPWACYWPYGPPLDAEHPNVPAPTTKNTNQPENSNEQDECPGCVISPQRQSLGESLPVAGTPFELVYRSDQTAGYKNNTVDITLSGPATPANLKQIVLSIDIAGQRIVQSFSSAPSQQYSFEWDGLDGFGRQVYGDHEARITISHVYPCIYYSVWADFSTAWGRVGRTGNAISNGRSGCKATIFNQKHTKWLTSPFKSSTGTLGVWSLSAHHSFDPQSGRLLLGSGYTYGGSSRVIDAIVGTGEFGEYGDGGPAIEAALGDPWRMTFDSLGNLYIADWSYARIRRVDTNGIIETIAGVGMLGSSGDGGLATEAKLNRPHDVAVDDAGNLYISDTANNRIRRVGTNGIIETFAGDGSNEYSVGMGIGDFGPATEAVLDRPGDIAIDSEGNLYVVQNWQHRVRRISTDGIIETIAGSGVPGFSGDGGLATEAVLSYPKGITIDRVGNIYISDSGNSRIRRIRTDGIIETIAGTSSGSKADGILATEAKIEAQDIAIDGSGNIYFTEWGTDFIRRISTDGIIKTIAGNEDAFFDYDTVSMHKTLWRPNAVTFDGGGNLFFTDSGYNQVRRINSIFMKQTTEGYQVISKDGTRIFHFDQSQNHTQTVDTVNDNILYTFNYDENAQLISVVDQHGNTTTIDRDNSSHATAIIAPNGQSTDLTVDSNGHLVGMRSPENEQWFMNYTEDGLLTRFENPSSNVNIFTYDANGRLIRDDAPNGGGWNISRIEQANGYRTDMTSGEGRVSRFGVERISDGERIYTNQSPDGSTTVRRHIDSGTAITRRDGTLVANKQGPDPRFGMLAPATTHQRIETPSGLTLLQTTERAADLEDNNDKLSHTALTTTVTINDRELTAEYTAASRTWTHTSPEGRTRTSILNENGQLAEARIQDLTDVRYQYDSRGRLTQVARGASLERAIELSYDAHGYLASLTDAQGKTLEYQNDAIGRVRQQTFPSGATVEYDYDPNGNLTEIRLPSGELHRFQYNSVDQQSEYAPPNPDHSKTDAPIGSSHPTTLYQYNRDKQLETITRPDGTEIDYQFNATTGQLMNLVIPDGTYEFTYYGEFDTIHSGQLKTLTAPGGQQTGYEYDGFLLTSTTWSGEINGTLDYEYNHYFEPTSQTLNGNALSLSYNQDSQLTQAGSLNISYNTENGLLSSTSLSNLDTSNSYNAFGELASYSADYFSTALYQYSLHRDEVGRITGKTETLNGTTNEYQYLYDNNDRLEQVLKNGSSIQSWQYDANGNRTHENGTLVAQYDAQDRLTQYGDNQYRYTANGELTQKTNTTSGDTTDYHYDAFSNLRSVTLPDGTEIDYIIDGQNRRVGKKRNGILEQGFLYQGQLNPVAELDGSNNIVARFVYGERLHVPSHMIKSSTNYRIISDHLGSVRLVVNASTGEIAQRMDYDAWGRVIEDTNPGFQPFGYAGGIYDRDTGLVRFGARDYDPQVGRWTAKDPIGFGGGLNHYAYANNDSINYIDPEGLQGVYGLGGSPYSQYYAVKRSEEASTHSGPTLSGSVGVNFHFLPLGGSVRATPDGWNICARVGLGLYVAAETSLDLGCQWDEVTTGTIGASAAYGAGLAASGSVGISDGGMSSTGGSLAPGIGIGGYGGVEICGCIDY